MSGKKAFESGKAAKAEAVASGKEYDFESPYIKPTWIMMGGKDSPGGATAASVSSSPSLTHVNMYKGKQNIGTTIAIGGEVDHIQTHPDYRRQGVANAMFRLANFHHGRAGAGDPIRHSETRTPSGDAWAKQSGDDVPPNTNPSAGVQTNMLENLK